MGAELLRKYVSSSMIYCYRSVLRHPFLVCTLFVLIWMQRLFPLFFSFLVSSSPIIVSTAVLLGTLLSFGQPNIPEIEKEPKSEQYEIQKLESKVTSQTEVVGRDGNFAAAETNGSKFEVGDKSFEVINPVNDDNSSVKVDKPLYLVDDGEFVTEENCESFGEEHVLEESKHETDEVKVVLGSHYSPLQQSEDEHVVLESDDKLWEGSADPLNSDPALLWKRVEGDGYDDDDEDDHDDDDDDDESDSGSDLAESSSPDASMADILPMLDELHPLLSEEHEIHQEPDHEDGLKNHEDSEHSLGSSDSSSESNNEDGVLNHEDLEAGEDEEEDKESKHTDKEDEPRSAITWTEDDQKNLMNLGTSEMERNRRLENLIARRRARKTMRMQAEKNLIDLESADLPWNISPISTARKNPFDYDLDEHIPGSAPSVLLKRRNPFDLPYDSSEEKPDLVGDTFHQEFAGFHPKEAVFRRHESFNVGPSNFGGLRSERQETKLRPYFVPERPFQRQFSGISDSKLSSVPDTESVSSASDTENNDHIEDEQLQSQSHSQSLEPELVSLKDEEHSERPYFVPEHVDPSFLSFERQISEVSESKLSSVPDTESVSSADDLENKDHNHNHNHNHIELSQEPELISFEDEEIMESVQVPEGDERLDDEDEIEQEVVNVESSIAEVIDRSMSSSDEVSEQVYNEKEEDDDDDEVATSVSETSDYFVDDGNSIERSEIEVNHPKEPVYDSSPRAVSRNLSSSSVSNDLQAILERNASLGKDSQESVPKMEEMDSTGKHADAELVVEDHLHKDESFLSNSADVVLDMNASHSHQLEQVQVPSSSSNESSHQEVIISQPEVDPEQEQLQVQELKDGEFTSSNNEAQFVEVVHGESETTEEEGMSQSQKEVSLLDISANEPSEDIPELLQVQNTSNNLDNLQIEEELENDIHSNNVADEIDGVDEIDEDLLVELDAVGDFSVNDLVSTSNEMEDDPHVLQTKLSADEDSYYSKDLGLEQHPHFLDHDLEIKHSADDEEDSYSKDLGLEQHPDFLDHDLETKHSADEEDSYSKDLGATLDEMEHHPHALEHDLETKHSADEEDSYSKDLGLEQPPHTLDHDLETKHSADEDEDEDSFSKDLGATLDELKQDPHEDLGLVQPPHILDHDHETKHSADEDEDEDSFSKDLGATLDELKQDPPEDLGLVQPPHILDHDLETKHSADEDEDEDSFSKDLGATLDELKQDPHEDLGLEEHPHFLDRDLETKHSADEDEDEDSYSKDLGATLDELKQDPHDSKHDLETKLSGDEEDSYSEAIESPSNETTQEDPHALGHGLETFYSVDEYAFSKIVESALNDMKHDEPETLDQVLETNLSGVDEDLSKTKLKLDEQVIEVQNEKEKLTNMVDHGTEHSSSTTNTDQE